MRERPNHIAAIAAAVLGVLASWGSRWLLSSLFGGRVPFITFFPTLFALAWWGGFRPTFYAAILSALVLAYAILEPVGTFYISVPEYRFGLAVFLAVGLCAGWLGETLHSARRDGQRAIEKAVNEGERFASRSPSANMLSKH